MLTFVARPIQGSGRGKHIGTPTINVDLSQVPPLLEHGIYAVRAQIDHSGKWIDSVMHYGLRPVFDDSLSCEVHFLDHSSDISCSSLTVQVAQKLRDVQDFADSEDLKEQILHDIERSRAILASYDPSIKSIDR